MQVEVGGHDAGAHNGHGHFEGRPWQPGYQQSCHRKDLESRIFLPLGHSRIQDHHLLRGQVAVTTAGSDTV